MASISVALQELLCASELSVEEALTRHVADDYRQSTDGNWLDRAAFAQQLTQLRGAIERVEIEVLNELAYDRAYAERHVITCTLRDGSRVSQEVFVFAEIARDGRFARLEELTRLLPAE